MDLNCELSKLEICEATESAESVQLPRKPRVRRRSLLAASAIVNDKVITVADDSAVRRSGRKRSVTQRFSTDGENIMEFETKTAKLNFNEESDVETLKSIYLDRTVKLNHMALETIFEEPKDMPTTQKKSSGSTIMSARKLRRSISFDENRLSAVKKSKKRQMKAKSKCKPLRKQRVSIDQLMEALRSIEED